MPTLKYNGNSNAYPAPWHLSPQDVANIDFRLERLNPSGLGAQLQGRVVGLIQRPLLRLLQWLDVRPRIGRLLIVTRDDDVRAVLSDPLQFPVHYNPEMRELGAGASFMLALNGAPHDMQRACVQHVHTAALDATTLARTAAVAADLLAGCAGRINVMQDYFCRASAEAAIAYLGLATDDADSFADCTLAMSAMIFGDPFGGTVQRELASHAAWRLRSIADRSIALARLGKASGLVQALASGTTLGDDEIRANLLGLATALVPTNTLAAGNMLAYLLGNPKAWQQAVAAASAGDDARLKAILLEAGRLRPALDPGLFRYMPVAAPLPRSSRPRPRNSVVFVATAAALRDPARFARPKLFDPDRIDGLTGQPFDGGLMFGYGEHHCSGQMLAIDQIVILYRLLLRQPGLGPVPGTAGRLVSAGPFPRRLEMAFDAPAQPGEQTMLRIAVPCPSLGRGDADAELARGMIEGLGNPVAVPDLRNALDATGIVHFASINLIDAGTDQPVRHHLLVEVNADGALPDVLAATSAALGPTLLGLLARCGHRTYWGHPLDRHTLPDFLSHHRVRVQAWPWGATGLDFLGSRELPLGAKARDAALASFAARAVDLCRRLRDNGGKRAMETLRFVRAAIRQDPASWPSLRDTALARQPELAPEFAALEGEAAAHGFASALTMPSAQRLGFADWQVKTLGTKITQTLLAPDMVRTWVISAAAALGLSALLLVLAGLAPPAVHANGLGALAWTVLAILFAVVLLVLVAGTLLVILYRALRTREDKDRPDDRDPDHAMMAKIAGRENPPGFAQNHFLSVSRFKPGLFRRLSFAFALWGISIYVRFWGRPGFIEDMGTIHFAGWFRLPGTDRMVFHSNFDGSWESYLEDFVTKAHLGQTAVWSNAEGFPRANNLVLGGASDGDRFKRWVRGQQRPTQFWYSRFPALTLERARTNAIIRTGLARAGSDTEARAWLAIFGSQTAPTDTVETDEVQSIVFSSLPSHPFAACLLLSLPPGGVERYALLTDLLDGTSAHVPRLRFGDLAAGSTLDPVLSYLGLSAAGFAKCGLPGRDDADGLASFQHPFVAGMASRDRVLGDHGASAPPGWRWDDCTTDAVLWLMAMRAEDRDTAIAGVEARLNDLGGALLRKVPTDPVGGTSINNGHFAFADGFSQPALRGSYAAATALAQDLVAPGEFLFGYHNNQDCFAPSPRLRTELDPLNLLPDTSVDRSERFPAFQPNGQPPAFRDFGRNGSYLVVRELEQDANAFRADNEAHARDLATRYPGLEAAPGVPISAAWVAAKQIGRWPDGTPLARRAAPPDGTGPKPDDPWLNDFSYARDDPQGLRCPLGAHIRRANPRDGLQPDDPSGQAITNRHRIIRRGRSYTLRKGDSIAETGLVFVAVCADLERQFEFVQQRWIASADFHGLGEGDPLLSATGGRFTIPTTDGPVRLQNLTSYVTVRGGGYYFLPSRSALGFLRASSI